MSKQNTISVSELKNRLLEIVREVEKGKSYAVTKGARVVAKLNPAGKKKSALFGFAKIKMMGDILSPIKSEWSYDVENIRKTK